jgi:aryl-alcohol dehydrogenase-like predicted oxidoreductase
LLTLPAHIASQKLPQFSAVFNTWETLCSEFKLDSKTIAFEFAKSLNTPLVIGVETVDQLKENISNLEAIQQNIPFQELYEAIQPLLSKELLLPQFWTPPH